MTVINSKNDESRNVKFIKYDGKYPCLCTGTLTLEIEGKEYKFGYKDECNFNSFWSTGGSCGFTNNYSNSYVNENEWIIDKEELPEQFRKYAKEIDEVFNENVSWGCCGGCL